MRAAIHNRFDGARELPHLVTLSENLYGAVFFLMKLLPAKFIVESALASGELASRGTVVETTSGTFGLALAISCRLRGLKFIMISDPVVEPSLQRRIKDLGATVDIVARPAEKGGFQQARLDRLHEIRRANPGSFWPCQYDNPKNAGSYAALSELLTSALGQIDCVVGTVGSGGSMCGTVGHLRSVFPHAYAIGVDTFGSVLFGQRDAKRTLRGLGNSLHPRNLDHTVFDEVHWLDAASAFSATRSLHRDHSLYMGPTSGAAYWVAQWYARKNPSARTVVLLADEAYRYQDTVYDDDWLRQEGLLLDRPPREPTLADDPVAAFGDWSRYEWKRRDYRVVTGQSPRLLPEDTLR
jgi:cysteine synthase